jgi:hypothetical protein
MKNQGSMTLLRSVRRLIKGEENYRSTGDKLWLQFLRKESTILLRRALKFWFKVRIGR